MSATASFPSLPSPVVEQSGWYPSERSAKSRLRSFFSRTKSQDKVPRQYVETFPPHPSVAPLEHTKRSRSTTWSKGGPRQPSRNVAADPPPLFHAYSQARKQEFLDIPSSFTDTLFRNGHHVRRNSVSSETPSRSSLDKSPADVTLHKRNWSGASICSLSQKLFVLTTSGYVLQYSADGLNDRLPEKILELGPGSVAFASDAIPGKHWVLQISHDGASDHGAAGNKGSWSKWSFKHADNKRIVTDLFLVFEDARSFKDWLQVVRKEIAELGGLEYRPDSKHEDQMLPERRSLKAQRSLPSLPQSSSPASPNDLPPLPLRNPSRHISRSTTDSSIHTLNDLDQLRKPSFSDSQSISTTHTSFTSSVMSYGAESFTSVDEPPLPVGPQSRLSTPTQDDIGELSMYMATPRKSISIPKRTTSLENTNDIIPHDLFVQKNDSSSTTSTYKSRPISTVAPLPEPGHIRKVSARHRYDLQNLPVQPATPAPSRPSSTRSRSSSHTSYNYNTKEHSPEALHRRAVSYSLFPKTPLSDAQAAAALPSPPATTPGAAYESMCNYPLTPGSEGDKSRPSSRVGRVSSWRSNKMLSVDAQIAQSSTTEGPQRSPIVADSHFDTCFGTQVHPDAAARRKLSGHSSIGKITTTTLQPSAMDGPVPRIGQPPRKTRHVKGQKSMPALPRNVVMQPLGPPPSGPLPALPAEAPLSCLPLKKLSCMSGPERKPKPPPKHMKAESSDAVMTLRKLGKEPAAPKLLSLSLKPLPVPKANVEAEKSATQHTRNMSSISSVGSVTAWLASPRVAEFSAKCGLDDSDKENEEGDGKFLQVALTNGLGFSAEFESYMSP